MTDENEDIIWSGSDLPYMCLIDQTRTQAFRKAINATVKKGDVVVDVGSGTGILSFFAAAAGASKVYAVEIDGTLAAWLRESVAANGLGNVIEVIEGDALLVELPKNVDVVIAEIIETGLLEEMQVKVMNSLRDKGIIGNSSRVIPSKYETRLGLAEVDNSYYGFKVLSPIHNWPNYSSPDEGWLIPKAKDLVPAQIIDVFDFEAGRVDPEVNKILHFEKIEPGDINAFKIEGTAYLTDEIKLGATNTINGDKYIIQEGLGAGAKSFRVEYTMGRGLAGIKVSPN